MRRTADRNGDHRKADFPLVARLQSAYRYITRILMLESEMGELKIVDRLCHGNVNFHGKRSEGGNHAI